MVRADPQLLSTLRGRFRFVAVDELQDINAGQFDLLKLLAEPDAPGPAVARPRGVLCIGDPDQAIYGFRGSDRSLFYRFKDEFRPIAVNLSRNYRSSANIVEAASSVLAARQTDGRLPAPAAWSPAALSCVRGPGGRIGIFAAANPDEEGAFIAHTIQELMGGVDSISAHARPDRAAAYSFSDFAVLFRTRAVRDALLPSLLRAGLPVTFRESAPLCAAEPFMHVLSALRFLDNPRDVASLARLLVHLAPQKTLAELWPVARSAATTQHGVPAHLAQTAGLPPEGTRRLDSFRGLADTLQEILAEGGVAMLVERLLADVVVPILQEQETAIGQELLLESARDSGRDLSGFVALLSTLNVESEGPVRTEKILLLTFHAAKGLEFPVTFLAGAEEGITPLPEDLDEERRLFYVAMTRAADQLFISHCSTRRFFGQTRSMEPSRFLAAIPPACCESVAPRLHKGHPSDQLSLFP
jgi:superfamily I DNA/RNA helicase